VIRPHVGQVSTSVAIHKARGVKENGNMSPFEIQGGGAAILEVTSSAEEVLLKLNGYIANFFVCGILSSSCQ
jgi:hypothetical protein